MSLAQFMGRTVGPCVTASTTQAMLTSHRFVRKSSLCSSHFSRGLCSSSPIIMSPSRGITSVLSRKLNMEKEKDLPPPQSEEEGFRELGVIPELTQLLVSQNITTPTAIQELSIPKLLKGKDAALGAQTGTGKTLSFVLPIVQKLILDERDGISSQPHRPRALIIVPSRELAFQVLAVAKSLCHHPDARFRAAVAVGGESIIMQKQLLQGQDSFRATRARNKIAARERQRVIEFLIHVEHVARRAGMDKTNARRVARRFAWSAYVSHVAQHARGEAPEVPGDVDALTTAAIREAGSRLAERVALGELQLAVAFKPLDEAAVTAAATRVLESAGLPVDGTAEAAQSYFREYRDDSHEVEAALASETAHEEAEGADEAAPQAPAEDAFDPDMPELELGRTRNVDLLVGTPGRLKQLMSNGTLMLSNVQSVAVDEADFMFHPVAGFAEELEHLFRPIRRRLVNKFTLDHGAVPRSALSSDEVTTGSDATRMRDAAERVMRGTNVIPTKVHNVQMLFAGATLGGEFMSMVKQMFPLYSEPKYPRTLLTLETKSNLCLPNKLKQTWVRLGNRDKMDVLKELLAADIFQLQDDPAFLHPLSVMVFCNSIAACRAVQHTLSEKGISVVASHGDVPAKLRREYWSQFFGKQRAVMVSTDMSARGIDTRFLSRVINFDFPLSPVDYLHRAGRTARAADDGHVINLLTKGDEVLGRAIDQAHKEHRPITFLSSDKDVYRTDVPKELRKDAELMGASKLEIAQARRRHHDRIEESLRGRRENARRERDDAKLKRELMSMPWEKHSSRGGGGIPMDMTRHAKKSKLNKVMKDVKAERTGEQWNRVDKTSDQSAYERKQMDRKTRWAEQRGVDGPITSKSQARTTLMSDKAIREKVDQTLKDVRKKNFKKHQERVRREAAEESD